MIIRRQDFRNMIYLLIAQAVAVGVGLFAFTKIGRQLAVIELGRFGFALSSTVFFGLLAEFGTRYGAIKEIALNPGSSRQIYWHGAKIRWLTSFIAMVLLSLSTCVPQWRSERYLLLLAGLVAVTQFGSDPATWVLFGQGRVDLGAIILILDRMFYFFSIYIVSWFLPSAEGLLFATLLANILRMSISALWVRSRLTVCPLPKWNKSLFWSLLTSGAAIGIAIISFVAYSQLTVIMIKTFSSAQELGFYSIAFGIINVLLVIPTSFMIALFPTLAAGFNEGEQERNKLLDWTTRMNLVFALPIATVLFLFPDGILMVWVGAKYLTASLILRILATALAFSSLSFMYRIFIFASNRYKIETLLNICAIIATISLGVPLCKKYGGIGIAGLFVAIEGLIVISKILSTRRWLGSSPLLRIIFPGLLAVIIPAIIVELAGNMRLSMRAFTFVSGAMILMLVFRVFPHNLWRTIRDSLGVST